MLSLSIFYGIYKSVVEQEEWNYEGIQWEEWIRLSVLSCCMEQSPISNLLVRNDFTFAVHHPFFQIKKEHF